MKGEITESGVANFVQKAFDIISVSYPLIIEYLVLKNRPMVC